MTYNLSEELNTSSIKTSKWYHVFRKKRTFLLLLLPISIGILILVRNSSDVAEFIFARAIYKTVSQILSTITGFIPFSLMEVSILLAILIAIYCFIYFNYKVIRSLIKKDKQLLTILSNGLLNVLCIISVLLFLFLIFGGTNYYRHSFASYSNLEIRESSVEELYELTLSLAKEAAMIREELRFSGKFEDDDGVLLVKNQDWMEIAKTANKVYKQAANKYPALSGNYGIPKSVLFSKLMSRMEITGIFWPFTMEANVNIDATEFSIPATMAHEQAHQRGFMREDEANFIAYLVCKESDNLLFKYSGIMLALTYSNNQLYKHDSDLYYKIIDLYSEGMIADIREEYYYWKQFEDTVISTVSNRMNDTYLKANDQNDGVKSYGRMVDLLLAEYRSERNLK